MLDQGSCSDVYGMHAMLRLAAIEKSDILDEPASIRQFLMTLVTSIGMHVLDGPYVTSEFGDPLHQGHSAVVVLYESHAAIHTYPGLRALFLDVFSCKPFDSYRLVEVCTETFGEFTIVESDMVDRGHHWGRDAERELSAWVQRR